MIFWKELIIVFILIIIYSYYRIESSFYGAKPITLLPDLLGSERTGDLLDKTGDLSSEHTIENLYKRGYIIIRNAIDKNAIRNVRKSIIGNIVNYCENKEFIDHNIMPLIKQVTSWSNPSYYKFRTSNNNNSSDAGVFHRDLNNFTKNKEIWPIYTCICYLDGGTMEIIPDTFKNPVMDNIKSYNFYFRSKKIQLRPGDILLFNCLTIHRGIFSDRMLNRRLIQVFEIYPNDKIRSCFSKRVLKKIPFHSKNYDATQKFNVWCHKMKIPSAILNIVGYIYASKRIPYPQYNITEKDLNANKYFSQKATTRVIPELGKFYKSNCFVLNERKIDL